MFSLIITIISIVLVAVLAIATIWYGGSIYTSQKASVEASGLANQASQIYAAAQMYKQDNGAWPANPQILVDTNYLKALPSPSQGALHATASQSGYGGMTGNAYATPAPGIPEFKYVIVQRNMSAEMSIAEPIRPSYLTPHTPDPNDHTSLYFQPEPSDSYLTQWPHINTIATEGSYSLNGTVYSYSSAGSSITVWYSGDGLFKLIINPQLFPTLEQARNNQLTLTFTDPVSGTTKTLTFNFKVDSTTPRICPANSYNSGFDTCTCEADGSYPEDASEYTCPVIESSGSYSIIGYRNGYGDYVQGVPAYRSQLMTNQEGETWWMVIRETSGLNRSYYAQSYRDIRLNGITTPSNAWGEIPCDAVPGATAGTCIYLMGTVWDSWDNLVDGLNTVQFVQEYYDNGSGTSGFLRQNLAFNTSLDPVPPIQIKGTAFEGYVPGTSSDGHWTGSLPWNSIQETSEPSMSILFTPADSLSLAFYGEPDWYININSVMLNEADVTQSSYALYNGNCASTCGYLSLDPAVVRLNGRSGLNTVTITGVDLNANNIIATVLFDMTGDSGGETGGGGIPCPTGQQAGEGNVCRCIIDNTIPHEVFGCDVPLPCPAGQDRDSSGDCRCNATGATPDPVLGCTAPVTCETGQYPSNNVCLCTSNNQAPNGTWGCTDAPTGPSGSCPVNQFYHNGQCLCRSTTEAPINGACPLPPEYTKPAPQWGFVFNARGDLQYIVLQEVVANDTCSAVDRANTGRSLLLSPFEKVSIGTGINPKLTYQCVDSVAVTVGEVRPSQAGYTYYWLAPGAGTACSGIAQLKTALGSDALYCTENPSCPADQYLSSDATTCLCSTNGLAPDTLTGACGVPQCTANQYWNPIDRICVANAVCPAGQAVTPQNTCACLKSGLPPSAGVCPLGTGITLWVNPWVHASAKRVLESNDCQWNYSVASQNITAEGIDPDIVSLYVAVGYNRDPESTDIYDGGRVKYSRVGLGLFKAEVIGSSEDALAGFPYMFQTGSGEGWGINSAVITGIKGDGSVAQLTGSGPTSVPVDIEYAPSFNPIDNNCYTTGISFNWNGADMSQWSSGSAQDSVAVSVQTFSKPSSLGVARNPVLFKIAGLSFSDISSSIGSMEQRFGANGRVRAYLNVGLAGTQNTGSSALTDVIPLNWNSNRTRFTFGAGYAVGYTNSGYFDRANANATGVGMSGVYPNGDRGRMHAFNGTSRFRDDIDGEWAGGAPVFAPSGCPSYGDTVTLRLFEDEGQTTRVWLVNKTDTGIPRKELPIVARGTGESQADLVVQVPANSAVIGRWSILLENAQGLTKEATNSYWVSPTYRYGRDIKICAPPTCEFNGQSIPANSSRIAYAVSSAENCGAAVQEVRSCTVTNGMATLSGSLPFASCTSTGGGGGGPGSCTFNGNSIADGQSVQAYGAYDSGSGSCASEARTCSAGVLSGSLPNGVCSSGASSVTYNFYGDLVLNGGFSGTLYELSNLKNWFFTYKNWECTQVGDQYATNWCNALLTLNQSDALGFSSYESYTPPSTGFSGGYIGVVQASGTWGSITATGNNWNINGVPNAGNLNCTLTAVAGWNAVEPVSEIHDRRYVLATCTN